MTRYLATALAGLLLSSVNAEARDISLQETVEIQSINQAITTTDGNLTAVTKVRPRAVYQDDDGLSYIELFVVGENQQLTPFITGDVRIGQIAFSHDERFIHYLARRGDDKQNSLYRIPLRGGESSKVLSHDSGINRFDESHDGRWLVFTSREKGEDDAEELAKKGFRAEIFEEQLRRGEAFLLDRQADDAEPQRLAVDEHIISAQFRPQHDQLLLQVAPSPFIDDVMMLSSYVLVDLAGNEIVRFNTEGKLGTASFSDDGQQLAIIGAEDRHDPATGRLYLADLSSGNVTDIAPGFPGHVQDISWQDNNTLVYLADVGTETQVVSYQLDSQQRDTLLGKGQTIVSRFTASSDNGFTLIANSVAHPNEAFTLQQDGSLERLTNSNPWLDETTQPRQETITYEARDGLRLEGILVYPNNYQSGQRVPVIMSIHGGPEAHVRNGWNDRYSSPTRYAAQQGFATFFPNYRGSTGRGVPFSKMGQNDYAGKEFDDIVDAKEHLVAIGLADENRIGITGGSYGGYASAWGATKQTEHFAASVMFVGISNNLSKFGTTDIPNEMHLVHARSYPWDKWQWYLERSPIYWAEQARTPILIMHGKEDTRVHPSQSMELYRYLKVHGNVPVRLVLYPGEGHGNSRAASQLDYGMRLMRWMNYYLVEGGDDIPAHELPHAEQLAD